MGKSTNIFSQSSKISEQSLTLQSQPTRLVARHIESEILSCDASKRGKFICDRKDGRIALLLWLIPQRDGVCYRMPACSEKIADRGGSIFPFFHIKVFPRPTGEE